MSELPELAGDMGDLVSRAEVAFYCECGTAVYWWELEIEDLDSYDGLLLCSRCELHRIMRESVEWVVGDEESPGWRGLILKSLFDRPHVLY